MPQHSLQITPSFAYFIFLICFADFSIQSFLVLVCSIKPNYEYTISFINVIYIGGY